MKLIAARRWRVGIGESQHAADVAQVDPGGEVAKLDPHQLPKLALGGNRGVTLSDEAREAARVLHRLTSVDQ